MKSISLQCLQTALDKSVDIGILEKRIEIPGLSIVLQNLRPGDLTKTIADVDEIHAEAEKIFAWQKLQIARAIVEVNGENLRGVKVVDLADGTKREIYELILHGLVDTWSKDMVLHMFFALSVLSKEAENQIKEVMAPFSVVESSEEKYRSLLADLKDTEQELASTLVTAILQEHGLVRLSTPEEIQSAVENVKATELSSTQESSKIQDLSKTQDPKSAEPLTPQKPAAVISSPPRDRTKEIAEIEGLSLIQEPVEPRPSTEIPELDITTKASSPGPLIDLPPAIGINPRAVRRGG